MEIPKQKYHVIEMPRRGAPSAGAGSPIEKGLYCDITIEPATNAAGDPRPGYDISVACDAPRNFFEDTRATLVGAQEYVNDCLGALILDKFVTSKETPPTA